MQLCEIRLGHKKGRVGGRFEALASLSNKEHVREMCPNCSGAQEVRPNKKDSSCPVSLKGRFLERENGEKVKHFMTSRPGEFHFYLFINIFY